MNWIARAFVIVTCILWMDAKGDVGWMDANEFDPNAPIISCGQLVKEDDHFIMLAMDRSPSDETINQVGSIPKAWIKERKDVEIQIGKGKLMPLGELLLGTEEWEKRQNVRSRN